MAPEIIKRRLDQMKKLTRSLRSTVNKDHRDKAITQLESYIDDTKFILDAEPEK